MFHWLTQYTKGLPHSPSGRTSRNVERAVCSLITMWLVRLVYLATGPPYNYRWPAVRILLEWSWCRATVTTSLCVIYTIR